MAVTKIDHIELSVNRFDEYVALFRALGFQERIRTKHHGDSVEFQLPGENQPVFEIHRVGGEEAIGVNHIAFQVSDVAAARTELQAQGIKPRRTKTGDPRVEHRERPSALVGLLTRAARTPDDAPTGSRASRPRSRNRSVRRPAFHAG